MPPPSKQQPPAALGFKPIATTNPHHHSDDHDDADSDDQNHILPPHSPSSISTSHSPRLSAVAADPPTLNAAGTSSGARARSPPRRRSSSSSGSSFDLFSHSAAIQLRPTGDQLELDQEQGNGLGLWESISVIVGTMIGSGIFVSPGPIYSYTESASASTWIWVVAGLLSMSGALCYAELGTMITGNGGEYAYLLEAYGRLPALAFIWTSVTLLKSGTAAILAATAAQYTCRIVFVDGQAGDSEVVVERIIALVCLALGSALNAVSPRLANRAQTSFFAAKVAALALICGAGMWVLVKGTGLGPLVVGASAGGSSAQPIQTAAAAAASTGDGGAAKTPTTGIQDAKAQHSILLALQAALWGFDGWNNLNYVTEKVMQPSRTLPLAILTSVTLVTLCYLLTNVAYLIVIPSTTLLSTSNHGMVAEFGRLTSLGTILLPLCIVTSAFGALASSLYTGSHLITAAASQSHLPGLFAHVHPTRHTPTRALALQFLLAVPLVLSTHLVTLIHWYAFASYLFYGLAALAVIVLRYASPTWRYAERPFKVNLAAPVVFVAVCVWMVSVAVINEPMRVGVLVVWMSFGFLVWAVAQGVRRWRVTREGVGEAGFVRVGGGRAGAAEEVELLE
ncbi:amino acid permease-domain-containing protein [Catenaria anguillulae PL171]|uniref:Amino acid permease-domain-containing protein n=1 Tax=Catenaria anguillulae PL171 TaxID=765915 RepID=A0A1Y2H6C6_9FUNG|nr:amino acid permease-domain-containing protein [Catenaria anguillulae PL171]